MNDCSIPTTDSGFVYLGMPIGTHEFAMMHFRNKFKKVEKAFYSLRGVGCKVGLLSPKSMAFIYKQYCQAICKFGMECIYIDEKTLGEFNVRQNMLLKTAVGIDSRCRTKPLLHCLKVEQINQVYHKHKVFDTPGLFVC